MLLVLLLLLLLLLFLLLAAAIFHWGRAFLRFTPLEKMAFAALFEEQERLLEQSMRVRRSLCYDIFVCTACEL